MISERKKQYYENECSKLRTSGAHKVPYKALKNLQDAENQAYEV